MDAGENISKQLQSLIKFMRLAPLPTYFMLIVSLLLIPGQYCLTWFFQTLHNIQTRGGEFWVALSKSNNFRDVFIKI